MLCVKPAVLVYRVPPRASNRGYRWVSRPPAGCQRLLAWGGSSPPCGVCGGPLLMRCVVFVVPRRCLGSVPPRAQQELPLTGYVNPSVRNLSPSWVLSVPHEVSAPQSTVVSPSPRVFWGSHPLSPQPKPVLAQPPVPNSTLGLETPRKGNRNLPHSSCLLPAQTLQLFGGETRHLLTSPPPILPALTVVTSCRRRSSVGAPGQHTGAVGGTGPQTPLPASQSRGVAAGPAGLERPPADHGQGQHGLHQAGGQDLG